MFDIGFSELLLIAVVGLVVIGPKDLPVVIRHVAKFMREVRGFYLGAKKQMAQVIEEAGLNELSQEVTTIIDRDGKPQKAYAVSGLEQLKSIAQTAIPASTAPVADAPVEVTAAPTLVAVTAPLAPAPAGPAVRVKAAPQKAATGPVAVVPPLPVAANTAPVSSSPAPAASITPLARRTVSEGGRPPKPRTPKAPKMVDHA